MNTERKQQRNGKRYDGKGPERNAKHKRTGRKRKRKIKVGRRGNRKVERNMGQMEGKNRERSN